LFADWWWSWICVFHWLEELTGVDGGSIASIARWLAGWHDKFHCVPTARKYLEQTLLESVFFFFWVKDPCFSTPMVEEFAGCSTAQKKRGHYHTKRDSEEGKKEHTGCKKQLEGLLQLLKSLFVPSLRQTCRVNFGASSTCSIPPPPPPTRR
jgi:hypothetical protein